MTGTTSPRLTRHVPRLALSPEEAAESVGVSRAHFYAEILPHVRIVYSGRRRLVSIVELERWLDRNARAVS